MVTTYISYVKLKKFLKANPSEIFYQVLCSFEAIFDYYF